MSALTDWLAKISEPDQLLVTAAIDRARQMLDESRDNKSVSWVSLEAKVAIYELVQERKKVRL